ncbi:MAG: hypothetical protein IPM29_06200 [Planctomycetes bacterium]|nr:hypothetical protein [Planctomycetota bacterium]
MEPTAPCRPSSSPLLAVAWLTSLLALAPTVSAQQQGVVYLAETNTYEIARYDLATGARRPITPGLAEPFQTAVRGRTAWVVEYVSGELSTVDLDTGAITLVASGLGQPFGLALEPSPGNQQPRTVYVAEGDYTGGRLLAVDTGTGVSTTIASGIPWSGGNIAIRPDGTAVYGAVYDSSRSVIAVDIASGVVSTVIGSNLVGTPRRPGVALSPDGSILYYQDWRGIWMAPLANPTLAAPFRSWASGRNLAISPDGLRLAVIDWNVSQAMVYDIATGYGVGGGGHSLLAVTFLDSETLLTSAGDRLDELDVLSGARTKVDGCLGFTLDLDVVGGTAYAVEYNAYPRKVTSIDLATGTITRVYSDPYWTVLSGMQASHDGTRLYFRRQHGSGAAHFVEFDLATRVPRPIVTSSNWSMGGFYVDETEGFAYVELGSPTRLARVDLATGVTTHEFFSAIYPLPLGMNEFGVNFAMGYLLAQALPFNPPHVGRYEIANQAISLQETVTLTDGYTGLVRPTADVRGLYAWSNTTYYPVRVPGRLVHIDMFSPGRPQTTLLSTDTHASAMCILNTADGTNVVATPVDPTTGTSPVTLTFDNVIGSGDTTVTTSATGPAIPAGFQLGGAGVYYEVSTTADFSGNVEICIDYTGTMFTDENTLQLLHWENGRWVNVTTTRDPATNRICGVVRSFSPFVVVEWPAMSKLNDLINRVHNLDVRHGIVVSLDAKLAAVQDALAFTLQGNRGSAVNCLRAFVQEAQAQSGRSLPVETADGLIADAEAIIAVLGG